jgi:RES domain
VRGRANVGPRVSLRLPERGSFEHRLRPVRVKISSLIRSSRRPSSEPYWSVGVYRFDAAESEQEDAFGVCYAASSLEVAFAESVIHETGRFVGGRYEVPREELAGRSVVRFVHSSRKALVLADLTGEALKALGLNNDISATDDYAIPQAWARAIHDAGPRWDGIRYISRQMNKGYA